MRPDTPEYIQCLFEDGKYRRTQKTKNLAGYISQTRRFRNQRRKGWLHPSHPLTESCVFLNHLGGQTRHRPYRPSSKNRFVGMKIPGAFTRHLEALFFTGSPSGSRDPSRSIGKPNTFATPLIPEIRPSSFYNGFWFAPEREAIQALVSETQKNRQR